MNIKLQRWFLTESISDHLGIVTGLGNDFSGEFRYLIMDQNSTNSPIQGAKIEENDQGEISHHLMKNGVEVKLSTPTEIRKIEIILAEKSKVIEYSINKVRYRYPGVIGCIRFRYEGPNKKYLTIIKMYFETMLHAHAFTPRFSLGDKVDPEKWTTFQIWKHLTSVN